MSDDDTTTDDQQVEDATDDDTAPVEDDAPAPVKKAAKKAAAKSTAAPVEDVPPPVVLPPCSLPPTCTVGEVSSNVGRLQRLLAQHGYCALRATDEYDQATAHGVQRLQRACRPTYTGPIHGVWDETTRRAACAVLGG